LTGYLDGKEKAVLEYVKEGDNVLNFWHTEVPVSYRGQGLGAHLAKVNIDIPFPKNFPLSYLLGS